MAFNRKPLNLSGEFNVLQKGTLIKCFEQLAAGTVSPQTAMTALTDSSTGSASNTLAVMTGVDGTGSNAAPLTATKNAVASLAAKINALRTDLIAAGVLK